MDDDDDDDAALGAATIAAVSAGDDQDDMCGDVMYVLWNCGGDNTVNIQHVAGGTPLCFLVRVGGYFGSLPTWMTPSNPETWSDFEFDSTPQVEVENVSTGKSWTIYTLVAIPNYRTTIVESRHIRRFNIDI